MKVAIVGGGVFGAAAALTLRERGVEVTLHEPGPIPHPHASSTDLSKVIRADYGADVFHTALMEQALPRWRRWNEALFARPLFHETGFAILRRGPLEAGTFEGDSHAVLTARGHALERLDAEAVARRLPLWAGAGFEDGYFNPTGGWAESGAVVAALLGAAEARGARLSLGRAVDDLDALDADRVVVAAGAWTPTLVPELAGLLRPVAQPVLAFAPRDPSPFRAPGFVPWAADISRTGWYGFPANADGLVKVAHHGRGLPRDPGERDVPADVEPRFRAFLRASLPALADAPLAEARLCFYCDSVDGDLWITRIPDHPRVVVASGGSGHGFKLAPLLGDWIADVALGGEAPARFRWREPEAPRYEDARFVPRRGRPDR
ncbi:MAG: FAD-dependent oxidoreductase [Sandaracinaceae bacterium]